ncbi:MAG: SRPBCC family protein [Polaromonas sp.]
MKAADPFNSRLDLTFERVVDVPKALVWRAWTEPALLKQWFCPLPWKTVDAEIDLRPGGIFRTTMQSPEGQAFPNLGCYLEVIPNEKLVWTNALLPGFRPAMMNAPCGDDTAEFMFTAIIALADHAGGTRYTATVIHADEAGCRKHAAMGFEAGWGTALDQLVAMVKKGV